MTAEDILGLQNVAEVSIAPDGSAVVYARSRLDSEHNQEYTSLVLHDLGSGEERLLTDDGHRDISPSWSPGGDCVAFVTDRGEDAGLSIFTLDIRSGELEQRTAAGAISSFVWAPNGKEICFVQRCPAPQDPNVPQGVRLYEQLNYKDPGRGWLDGSRAHLFIANLETGTADQITDGDWDDHSPTFSPDGRSVAFISYREESRDRSRDADVWVVEIATGELRRITEGGDSAQAPSFSPDGTKIAYYATGPQVRGSRFSHNLGLWVYELDGGATQNLLADWDRTASNVLLSETRPHPVQSPAVWSTDGGSLLFIGSDAGRANVFRIGISGGSPTPITVGDQEVICFDTDSDLSAAAAVISTFQSPPQVFLLDLGGGQKQLTDLNRSVLDTVYLAPPEDFAFQNDGVTIHGLLAKPVDFDPSNRYPLILRIAGGPGYSYGHSFAEEVHVLAGAGFVVLQTNPRGSQGFGQDHALAITGDWNNKDYDDLMKAVDRALELGYIDPARLGVMGASYGGHMTNWIVTQTDRFAAAVSQRGMSNFTTLYSASAPYAIIALRGPFGNINPYETPQPFIDKSPITYVKDCTTPLLLIMAGRDVVTPVEQAEQMYVALKYFDREAQLLVFEDEGHYVRRHGKPSSRVFYLRAILDWFERFIDTSVQPAEPGAVAAART